MLTHLPVQLPLRHTLTAILVCCLLPASGQTLDQTLARMDKASAGFKGVTAKVKKTSHTAVINESSVETGRMSLVRRKAKDVRMLVEFGDPDPRSVFFAGKKIQIHYPKLKTVQEYDLGKQGSLLDQFLLLGFGTAGTELRKSYEMKFIGVETVSGAKTSHIELKPHDEEAKSHIRQVDLWISEADGQPLQQKILQPSRDFVLITYSDLMANPPGLTPDSVKLTVPKGTKVERPQK